MLDSITQQDLCWGVAIATAFLLLIGCAELLRRRWGWQTESTRKVVHLGGGVICMLFPFLIHSHWVVLALAVSMAALFLGSRRFGFLPSVHAIDRVSRGSEFYPVVIYILFLISAHTPWKYVICVLVLAIADAAAAIIGTRFGRMKYEVENEQKSIEGSLAFFLVTLLAVFLPLIFFRPQFDQFANPFLHYALAAVLIGLLVTCFEAVSQFGRDNLYVPLGTYLVLSKTFQTDIADLVTQSVSFILILGVLLFLSRRSRSFQTGGAIVICLASYGCWAMGSFEWALPIFIGYGLYLVAALTTDLPWKLSIRPVVFNVLPPFLILVIGNIALNNQRPDWTEYCFGPFLAACIVALAQAVFNAINWKHRRDKNRNAAVGLFAGLICFVLVVGVSAWRLEMHDWQTLTVSAITASLICGISGFVIPPMPPRDAPFRWFAMRMGFATAAAITIAILQLIQWCEVWNVPVT